MEKSIKNAVAELVNDKNVEFLPIVSLIDLAILPRVMGGQEQKIEWGIIFQIVI